MERRYLVTGGAGFIGSHLVGALLARGANVRVLDDYSTGNERNLQEASKTTSRMVDVVNGDLRDVQKVKAAVRGVDVVFHEAAFVSVAASMDDPRACFDVNCGGTISLLDEARAAGVKRVVLASSAAVYGDSEQVPLTETTATGPLSPYAASKLVDEVYATLYTKALGLDVCALRYFNVYGPRQSPDTQYAAAVPIFIRQLLADKAPTIFGDGGQSRDLIYVGDVVRANLLAAEHAAAPGQVFNVCTGVQTSIADLIEALRALIPGGRNPNFAPARAGDIYESVGSPSKIQGALGFAAETPLREGLKETVDWMR